MQETEAVLRYASSTLHGHPADRFSYPGRVSTEQIIVFWRTQEFYNTQFHNEVVDKLLRFYFCNRSFRKIALDVSVEERRYASKRHRCPILLLNCSQVCKIEPLECFLRRCCRSGNIEAVHLA
ncbi:hypothetical protein D3C77_548860 [compost metagenome]